MSPSDSTAARDWTLDLPQTPHVQFFRNVDWAATDLGPTATWSTALRMYTHMVMSDSRAATLYWGPDHIAVYNAQFVPLAAGAHPLLMGQSFGFGFPELLPFIGPMFHEGVRSGVAQDVIEAPMMVQRNGYKEETFFTGNFTPIRGLDGKVEGFYNALFEVTLQKIHDRRTHMLNLIATPGTLEVDAVYAHIMKSLEAGPLDIPLALLHEADTTTLAGRTALKLRGHLGIPEGHALLRDGQDLEDHDGVAPMCREALAGRVVTRVDSRFDGVTWLGFGEPTDKVITVALTTGVRLFGFLTVGTNPCRPFDSTCEQFTVDLTRMASSVLASAWDAENLRRKQERLQLELEFSDMKVRHLVQHASVGMVHAKKDGSIIWANEMFFALAGGLLGNDNTPPVDRIYDVFLEEDRDKAAHVWRRILSGEPDAAAELRLKRLFVPPVGDPQPAIIQILAFPYKEHGLTMSGMACTTEISRLKWAEAWQARIAADARAAKQQQEAFIDVVSHEMRNPLSAIVHCADTISASISDIETKAYIDTIPDAVLETLRDNVANAHTILDCAKHQKRIIDDVLTLGRLESTLLSVTPAPVRPSKLVDSVMALFDAELRTNDITTSVIAETSIKDLQVEYLNLDPSRVTQIFMNLLTNAIKFVKGEKVRRIEVRYGASLASPRSTGGAFATAATFPQDLHWAPKGKNAIDVTDNAEWGTAEVVFLTFSLRDTGIGMNNNEITKIFERFRQANTKTHVTYGGSGLGLYISKELTEKMGGEIGVMSRSREGSRFVFYIKTRRTETPPQEHVTPARPTSAPTGPQSLVLHKTMTVPSPHPKLWVLLVEDNVINQRVLRKHLTKSGCEVEVANHGVEALSTLESNKIVFDVVLMDMQMPVMDGLTCTSEIRRLELTGHLKGRLPIIAVTANVRQEQIDAARKAGADRVVQKPFKAADLVGLMRELVVEKRGDGRAGERERLGSKRSTADLHSISLPALPILVTGEEKGLEEGSGGMKGAFSEMVQVGESRMKEEGSSETNSIVTTPFRETESQRMSSFPEEARGAQMMERAESNSHAILIPDPNIAAEAAQTDTTPGSALQNNDSEAGGESTAGAELERQRTITQASVLSPSQATHTTSKEGEVSEHTLSALEAQDITPVTRQQDWQEENDGDGADFEPEVRMALREKRSWPE